MFDSGSAHQFVHRDGLSASVTPTSRQLWSLDWTTLCPQPLNLTGSELAISFDLASSDDVENFVVTHYPAIFRVAHSATRLLPESNGPAKRAFLELSDRFAFRCGGATVGVLVGNPIDWSSYYWRTVAFVPRLQGRGVLAAAMALTEPLLAAAGVERIEGDVAPTNTHQLRALQRLGYTITGHATSERWGVLLRLTKFLHPIGAKTFAAAFCRGPAADSRDCIKPNTMKGYYHEEIRNTQLLTQHPDTTSTGAESHEVLR